MAIPIISKSATGQKATLIFLHGIRDSPKDWISILKQIQPPHMKIVCPKSLDVPISALQNRVRGWFDIKDVPVDVQEPEDFENVIKSTGLIHNMINDEIYNGIPSNRTIIGGFSQGAAMALYAGLTYPKPIGGIILMSGWVLYPNVIEELRKVPKRTPILMAHGKSDPHVPYWVATLGWNTLSKFMYNMQITGYENMQHECCKSELEDIRQFIDNCIREKSIIQSTAYSAMFPQLSNNNER